MSSPPARIIDEKLPILLGMDYKRRLAAAMKRADVSGAELARAIGATSQSVSLALSGKSQSMNAESTARAARFLKVDAHWLATGEGQMEGPPEPSGLTPEALLIAKWFDRLTDPRDRAYAETLVMAAILRVLQKNDLQPSAGQGPGVSPGIPPAQAPAPAPADQTTPAKTHSGPGSSRSRRGQ